MERQPTPCQQQQGQLVVGGIGAVAGFFVGGPTGAMIGWTLGSMAGSLLFPNKTYGPRLNDTKVKGADYGQFVTILYGTCRIGGWGEGQGSTSEGPNKFTEHEEKQGGKGGPEQINFTYSLSFFNGICEGPIVGVWRRWVNARLITEGGAASSPTWPYTLYLGTATQTVDPTMELVYGVGEVCPMRGRAYESVEELGLTDYSNARPNVEYEAYTNAGTFPWRVSTFNPYPDGAGHLTATYRNGRVTVGVYHTASLGIGHYYERVFDVYGVEDTDAFFESDIIGGGGFPTYPVRNMLAAADGSDWYQRQMWICTITANPFGTGPAIPSGQPPVYINDYIFTLGAETTTFHGGVVRWKATGGVISNETATADSFFDLGVNFLTAGWTFTLILGTSNQPDVVYLFNANTNFLHELAFDLSGELRHWDLTAEMALSPIFGGDTFTVYKNATGQLILCNTRGIIGAKEAFAWYLNDDLTVTQVDGVAFAVNSGVIELGTSGFALIDDGIISLDPPPAAVTLGSIVEKTLIRAGLTSGQIDVTDLTQLVRGAVQASQMTGFNFIDTLRKGFFFDGTEYDGKLVFRNRGHGATETIPDGDLCAHEPGSDPPEPLEVTRVPEAELPRTVYINFYNYDNEYQTGSQYWRRTVTRSQSDVTLDLPIVFTAGEALRVAQWHMHFAWLERDHFVFYVTEAWIKLRPTNVVVVRGVNIRITKVDEMPTGIIKCEGVRAFAGAFTGSTITDPIPGEIPGDGGSGQPPQNPPSDKADTGLILIDGPWISEGDSPTALRAAMYKDGSGAWSGASLMKSVDGGTTYPSVALLSTPSTVGTVATALPAFSGGNVVDEANVIRVTLADNTRTLTSTTDEGLLNGLNLFALGSVADGWEFGQYRTATLISPGVWDLSGLLRYRFGTEWKTHAASEIFVLIETTVLVPGALAEINQSRKYKAVTFGTAVADAAAVDFTNTGVALKPLSPVLLGGGRNAGGDLLLNWIRRTRGSGGWPDGVDLPLNEAIETYVLEFATDSTFTTIVRTPGSLTPSYTYTAAMQTADFGSPQAVVNWRVTQVGSVGWGYFTKAAS